MIAIACAVATGPLLASAAISVRDYVSSGPSEPDDDGFSLDGGGVFIDPGTGGGLSPHCVWDGDTCVVTGWGGDDGGGSSSVGSGDGDGWGWGGGWGGDDGGGSSSGGSDGGDPPPEVACARGDGDVRMTFDGRTIRVTAGYSYSGQDLASLQAYVAGIESIWTLDFPAEGIGIVVDLVPDPDGFAITLDPNYHGREELQPNPGGNWEMRLGPLAGFVEPEFSFKMRVAAHEFGHFWFGANLPASFGLPISIMANARDGSVLSSDLYAMVQACQTGGYAG